MHARTDVSVKWGCLNVCQGSEMRKGVAVSITTHQGPHWHISFVYPYSGA